MLKDEQAMADAFLPNRPDPQLIWIDIDSLITLVRLELTPGKQIGGIATDFVELLLFILRREAVTDCNPFR